MTVAPPSRAAWWWVACGATGLMAVLAVAVPRAALAMLIATTIGLAALLAGYTSWALLQRLTPVTRSDFAPAINARPPQPLPPHIARIVPGKDVKRPQITPGARAGLVTVATERLWARHGLNLHAPADQAQIQRLISPQLWGVVRPDPIDPTGHFVPRPSVPHSSLDQLLDELDRI